MCGQIRLVVAVVAREELAAARRLHLAPARSATHRARVGHTAWRAEERARARGAAGPERGTRTRRGHQPPARVLAALRVIVAECRSRTLRRLLRRHCLATCDRPIGRKPVFSFSIPTLEELYSARRGLG